MTAVAGESKQVLETSFLNIDVATKVSFRPMTARTGRGMIRAFTLAFQSLQCHLPVLLSQLFGRTLSFKERVRAGIKSAKHQGKKLGRKRVIFDRGKAREMHQTGATVREIATALHVGAATIHRFLASEHGLFQKPTGSGSVQAVVSVLRSPAQMAERSFYNLQFVDGTNLKTTGASKICRYRMIGIVNRLPERSAKLGRVGGGIYRAHPSDSGQSGASRMSDTTSTSYSASGMLNVVGKSG